MATLAEVYRKVYDAVYQLCELEERLDSLNKAYQTEVDKEKTFRKKQFGTGIGGQIIALLFIVVGLINGAIMGAIKAFFLYAILGVIIDTVFFEKKRNSKADRMHEDNVVPIEKEIAEIDAKIKRLYNTKVIKFYLTHFPPECQSLEALDYFVDAIYYKKAESEKEYCFFGS